MLRGQFVHHEGTVCQIIGIVSMPRMTSNHSVTRGVLYYLHPVEGDDRTTRYRQNPKASDLQLVDPCPTCGRQRGMCPNLPGICPAQQTAATA